MHRILRLTPAAAAVLAASLGAACSGGGAESLPEVYPRSGGMTTAFEESFSLSARNINHYERQVFADGKVIFETTWTAGGDGEFTGLGPSYDASSCSSCHTEDGRGPNPGGDGKVPPGMIVRVEEGESVGQLHQYGPEPATVQVTYEAVTGTFGDRQPFTLRRPLYEVIRGPDLPADAVLSPRIAPPLPGMGLLELIEASDMNERADPSDADSDGISGEIALGKGTTSQSSPGRFGWQASQPTVRDQTAGALLADMGLSSPGPACGEPCVAEVTSDQLYALTIYALDLAVPAVRDVEDADVRRGRGIFDEIGCRDCHAGPYTTGEGDQMGLSGQLIDPYTDLLLHDMGPDLADRTVAGDWVATQWRTAPLWGIGLTGAVNENVGYMHDGRARTLAEAILWHGGEGQDAAEAFRTLPAADRGRLLSFLEAL